MLSAEVVILWIFLLLIVSVLAVITFLAFNLNNRVIEFAGVFWKSAIIKSIRKTNCGNLLVVGIRFARPYVR